MAAGAVIRESPEGGLDQGAYGKGEHDRPGTEAAPGDDPPGEDAQLKDGPHPAAVQSSVGASGHEEPGSVL